jgi:predicted metalloprotease with PDZ domain
MASRVASMFVSLLSAAACATAPLNDTARQTSPDGSMSPPSVSAAYVVAVQSVAPIPVLSVRAELRLPDDTIRMEQTRPGDAEEILRQGWPAMVRNLRVLDERGARLPVTSVGAAGWVVPTAGGGNVIAEYEVDYQLLVDQGWPAPRESAYADDSTLFIVARSAFVGSDAPGSISVRFVVPDGWRVYAPWTRDAADPHAFHVPDLDRLTTNALAVTRARAATARVGGVTLETVTFGRWHGRTDEIAAALRAHLTTFTRLFEDDTEHSYLAVFFDSERTGGEAYLNSYAMQADPWQPASAWARLIGHELFHYWNGQRLRGADYTASQWFAEGITEYVALLSMAQNGFMSEQEVLDQLSQRLRASRNMTASLVASGNRKNAAFYGRATITALLLDLLLRERTNNQRGLPDLMRVLWQSHGITDRPYTLADLYSVASKVAGVDVAPRIRGWVEHADRPEMDSLLATAGLMIATDSADERILVDPSANHVSRARWRAIFSR